MIAKLSQLPKPKNDFELEIPKDEEDRDAMKPSSEWVEDAAEVNARRTKAEQRRLEKERKLRSQAFQRGLPLPTKVNDQYHKKATAGNEKVSIPILCEAVNNFCIHAIQLLAF
jgi:pre-mRNA-splicing factor CDC5/CEF1